MKVYELRKLFDNANSCGIDYDFLDEVWRVCDLINKSRNLVEEDCYKILNDFKDYSEESSRHFTDKLDYDIGLYRDIKFHFNKIIEALEHCNFNTVDSVVKVIEDHILSVDARLDATNYRW